MRLRLSIQRHALPPAEVLWTVSEEQALKLFSIAQLLEEINHIIPLESQDWGLEDYVVEVGGFECFHFAQVAQVLKDEDRICIRALQTPEIRARTLSGRYQISENGQHLIDGIPFGRPYLRQPNRPAIHIPPRKRRRLTYGEEEEEFGEGFQEKISPALKSQHWKIPLDDLEDDDEDDDDFSPNSQINSIQASTTNRKKTVRFKSQPLSKELITVPSEDEDESEEYDPHWDSESSEASDDEESELESGADAPEDDPEKDLDEEETSHESEASSLGSSSGSDTSSEASGESEPEELSSKHISLKQRISVRQNPPFQDASPYREGKKATQERNRRRRDTRRIRRLQMVGILPATAKRNDLRALEAVEERLPITEQTTTQSRAGANMTGKARNKTQELDLGRQRLLTAIEAGGIDVTLDRLEKQFNKKEVSSKKMEGKRTSPASESNIVESEVRKFPGGSSTAPSGCGKEGPGNEPASDPPAKPPQKRARIDLAGSRRLLFGSLGVRNPKTKAEEEKLKAKLMAAGKVEGNTKLGTQPRETRLPEDKEMAAIEDPNAWKSKINLTAFECWDDGIELSTPPFPFQQRWDPQQKKGKNKKRKRMDAQYYEGDEETFGEGDWDVSLNYDDEEDLAAQTSDRADVDITIQSQLQLDIEDAAIRMEPIDDLPPLPADLSTLPALKEEDIKRDNIIVFKQLECSPATNWAPVISPFRTAIVEEVTEIETFGLRLAKRDQPHKHIRYDENGKRIYEKFEMEYHSENEDTPGVDGLIYLSFEDLIEPKLLQFSPETAHKYDAAAATTEDVVAEAREEPDGFEGQTHGVSPCSSHAIDDEPSVKECHMHRDNAGKDEIDSLMNGKNAMERSTLVETSA